MPIEAQKLVTRFEGDDKHLDRTFRTVERKTGQHLTKVENLYRNTQGRLVAASNAMATSIGGSTGLLPGMAHISEIIQGIPQIGRLAGGLIRPLTDAAQEGIRLNMVLETAEIGFEGIAGSSKRAKEHIAALMAFGQRSPFRFEGLLEASRFMTAFGFELEDQIPKLTIWGNAIAASGELSADKINDVVRAFGQMRLAGRVNAQDMNQLINANIPAWELLARAIGKNVAETRKLSEAGKLKGPEAMEAMTAMMATDPRFKDMMKRMEKTGAGRLSAAQDILQFGQAKATTGLTADISTTLGAALEQEDVVGKVATAINSAISPVSGMIRTAAVGMLGGGLTEGLIEGIQAGKEAVKQAVGDLAMDGIIGTAKSWLGIQSPSTVFHEVGELTVEGFENGLVDRTSKGFTRWAEALEKAGGKAFIDGIAGIAKRIGVDPAWLLNVIAFESGFNPRAANPGSSGRGLIQFMNPTARGLGFKNSNQITQLSAMDQLPLVERYFKPFAGKMGSQGDVYAAVAAGRLPGKDDVLFKAGSKEYAANKIWDVNRDRIITATEIGALAALKGGFMVGGSAISDSNPLPVYFSRAVGGAGRVGTADPVGGARNMARPMGVGGEISSSFGGFTFKDVTWTDSKARFVIDSFKTAEDRMLSVTDTVNTLANQVLPRAIDGTNVLGDAAVDAALDLKQQTLGAGEWATTVIQQTADLRDRFDELRESLPTFREELNDIFVSLPSTLGGIWGNAIRTWDGSFKGFLSSLAQGVQQTLADIAAQLATSMATKFLTSPLGSVLGGGGGSWASFGKSLPIPGRASGGPIKAGMPYYVHKDELIVPDRDAMVFNKSQQRGMGGNVVNNISVTIPVSRGNSFHQRQTRRQIAEGIAGILAA